MKKITKKTQVKKSSPAKKAVKKVDTKLAKKKVTRKDVTTVLNDPDVKKALAQRDAKKKVPAKKTPVKKAKGKSLGEMNDDRITEMLQNTWEAICYDFPEGTDPRDVVYDYIHTHGGDKEAADAFYAHDIHDIDRYFILAFPSAKSSRKAAKKSTPAKKVAKKTTVKGPLSRWQEEHADENPAKKSPKGKPPRKMPKGVDPNKPILARVKAGFSKKIYAQFEDVTYRYGINAALGKLEKMFKDPDVAVKSFYYRTGEDLDTKAEQLLKLADKNGIGIRAAAKFVDVQKELGLGESEITEHLIRRAEHFDRTWTKKMRAQVDRINGKRGVKKRSLSAPQERPEREPQRNPTAPDKGNKGQTPSKPSSAPQGAPSKPSRKGRGASVNGLSNKDIAFAEWKKEETTGKEEADRIHKILKGAVQLGSVRGWISQWSKGKNFPASAKK